MAMEEVATQRRYRRLSDIITDLQLFVETAADDGAGNPD
jgi:hypothetical protein